MERKCIICPAFFEVKEKGLVPTGGGWSNHKIDGKNVICCRPGRTIQKKKTMDRFCYYCLATPKAKKIGSKASWTGRTPIWCPLGREVHTDDQEKA
jgi:hypothetical protein